MDPKQEKNILKKLLSVSITLLLIYTLVIFGFLFFDIKKHPEDYYIIDDPLQGNLNFGFNLSQTKALDPDSWESKASNVSQCKPLFKWMAWAKWFTPLVYVSIIIMIINFVIRNYEWLKKRMDGEK